jgi:hypothetical protein
VQRDVARVHHDQPVVLVEQAEALGHGVEGDPEAGILRAERVLAAGPLLGAQEAFLAAGLAPAEHEEPDEPEVEEPGGRAQHRGLAAPGRQGLGGGSADAQDRRIVREGPGGDEPVLPVDRTDGPGDAAGLVLQGDQGGAGRGIAAPDRILPVGMTHQQHAVGAEQRDDVVRLRCDLAVEAGEVLQFHRAEHEPEEAPVRGGDLAGDVEGPASVAAVLHRLADEALQQRVRGQGLEVVPVGDVHVRDGPEPGEVAQGPGVIDHRDGVDLGQGRRAGPQGVVHGPRGDLDREGRGRGDLGGADLVDEGVLHELDRLQGPVGLVRQDGGEADEVLLGIGDGPAVQVRDEQRRTRGDRQTENTTRGRKQDEGAGVKVSRHGHQVSRSSPNAGRKHDPILVPPRRHRHRP